MTAPDLTDVKAYLGATVNATDAQIQAALNAEKAAQITAVKVGDYGPDITEALMRRVARNLAMRNVPLGVQSDGETSIRLGSTDPEVRRLEAPYRRLAVA